jgi:hypothetical protein
MSRSGFRAGSRAPSANPWASRRSAAIEAAHEAGAPLDITPRDADLTIPGAERLPTGSLRLTDAGQVSALPGFAEGAWWVQDAAAALPVRLLGDVRGKRVLDMCAAPGGKTLQLAAAGADVVALDLSDTGSTVCERTWRGRALRPRSSSATRWSMTDATTPSCSMRPARRPERSAVTRTCPS